MRRIISFLLIFSALAANARQVTPEEAQTIATEFFNSSYPAKAKKALRRATVQPAHSAENQLKPQPYYIYNAPDNAGFVIVSGDTRAKKILGYSDRGSIDLNNIPPQLNWLLSEYNKGISSIGDNASTDESWEEDEPSRPGDSKKVLETVAWDQESPFNMMCPSTEDHKTTLVGCTATAMAIAMRYHKHPEHGVGSHEYYCSSLSRNLKCDFEKTQFDWDLMPSNVNGDSPESHKIAVANLMQSLAISINSVFGCANTGANYGTSRYSSAYVKMRGDEVLKFRHRV